MLEPIEVRKRLSETMQELARLVPDKDVYLILVGSAVLIVRHGLKRSTKDMDVIVPTSLMGIGGFLQKQGFQVVSEVLINLHPDYTERLELLQQVGRIRLMALNAYDIAIAKIARGLDHDIDDLIESKVCDCLVLNRLDQLYHEAMDYWIGNRRFFELNWERFRDEYDRRVKERNRALSTKGRTPPCQP